MLTRARSRLGLWILPFAMGCSKTEDPPPTKAQSAVEPSAPAAEAKATKPSLVEAHPNPMTATPVRPLYYERPLTEADLEDRTLRELSLMRNTIFARAGNQFRKSWLDGHFRAQPWYEPADEMREDAITDVDRANAKLITEAENGITRAELEQRRDALLAKADRNEQDELELRLIGIRLGSWVEGVDVPAAERTPLEDPSLLDELLTVRQLEELSRRDLRILRNTIYARRGRSFNSDLLSVYFDQMDWYEPDPSYDGSKLTAVDRKNVRIVRSVEDTLGGPLADYDHMVKDGWLYGA